MEKRIKELIKKGESGVLEFKTAFGKETIETLCAFANSDGGIVFIGINDKGNAIGVDANKESTQKWINQIKSSTYPAVVPDVEILKIKDKQIISLSVTSYPVKPVSFKGKYYKRKHNSNHLMDLSEIANEHLKTVNLSWDFAKDPDHIIDDISLAKVNAFIGKTNSLRDNPINDDPLVVLRKFELFRENSITFGCFLLFCNEPSILSTIDAGRFDSEIIIRDNKTIRGDLFTEVDDCIQFIRKHISKRFIISDKPERTEEWEYPPEALREIVINMIVHRDYRLSGDSTIKIFENRIEFINPGALPQGVSLSDILSGKTASISRNKQIASIFKEAGIIEKYGSGIKRVREVMKKAGTPEPVFETIGDCFKVTLFPITPSIIGGVNGGVSGGVNSVKELISEYPGICSKEIVNRLNLSKRTLERNIKELKKDGEIEFRGAPKTGGYYVLPNNGKQKTV
ncbi:MAG: putative DNA binding domain-containing protein [Proteobacteria bacterium]|nr:putative DNA binding domain-containing protein [Pseudomonadota bacterium]